MKITALIHTRNEERWIEGCLCSVQWADEIIVADMGSTDRTRELAAALGARIIEVPLASCVEVVRNQAVAQCAGDWVLVVDADETVPPTSARRLRELSAKPSAAAYAFPRRNYFLGEWVEHIFWPDHQIRFFRRGAAAWSGVVHQAPAIQGTLEFLPPDPECALGHHGYGNDISRFLFKSVHYAKLEVERMRELGPEPWPCLLRRPIAEFTGRYFGGGWRHGMNGFVRCLNLALTQLVVVIHYWEAVRHTMPSPPSGGFAASGAVGGLAHRP